MPIVAVNRPTPSKCSGCAHLSDARKMKNVMKAAAEMNAKTQCSLESADRNAFAAKYDCRAAICSTSLAPSGTLSSLRSMLFSPVSGSVLMGIVGVEGMTIESASGIMASASSQWRCRSQVGTELCVLGTQAAGLAGTCGGV